MWLVVVPSPRGPSVSRWRSAARFGFPSPPSPFPPPPPAGCGVAFVGGVAGPCVRRARPPSPTPVPGGAPCPFPLVKDLRPGVVGGSGVMVVGVRLSLAGPLATPPGCAPQLAPLPPSLVGPLRPSLRAPYQRHVAAAGLLPRCTLVRFAGCRCVRFFCSFVAAVRSTPSGEAVEGVGVRAP